MLAVLSFNGARFETPDPQIRSLVLNDRLNEASRVAGVDAGLDYRVTSIGETL
jgi:hypothetical protein